MLVEYSASVCVCVFMGVCICPHIYVCINFGVQYVMKRSDTNTPNII